MPSTRIDELRDRVWELESQQEELWDSWTPGEEFPNLPRGKNATLAKLRLRLTRIETVEVYFDRLDLGDFQLGNGRTNRRAIARLLCEQLKLRNENVALRDSAEPVEKVGLRTMEHIVDQLLEESEKPI